MCGMGSGCWRRSRGSSGPGGGCSPRRPITAVAAAAARSGSTAARSSAHFEPRADHLRFFTRRTLAALLDAGGFEEIATRARRGTLLVSARAR